VSQSTITLDVREDLRQGREPFSRIMNAARQLGANETLLLVAPFEPAPLFSVLGSQGFDYQSKRLQSGDWEVLFTRQARAKGPFVAPAAPPCNVVKTEPVEIIDVDARGLEPPQPLIKILEALAALPEGAELRAHTERKPMHLYVQLQERGFVGQTEKQEDGSFITRIRRS